MFRSQTVSRFFHYLRSDSVSSVLIAVSSRFCTFKSRHDLQFYEECAWVQISTYNGHSLVIGNHFTPDTKPDVTSRYFCSLVKNLDTRNYSFLLIGVVNAPNCYWEKGLPLTNCYVCSKLRDDAIYTTTCFLGVAQCLVTDKSLDLVFTNFNCISTCFVDVGVVKPDPCHPPNFIEMPLNLLNSTSEHKHSYCKYALGNYSFSLSFLSNYD